MRAKDEKGMTLVEVLAALVILGIVFVGFMTIFPQMSNFNSKTEAKLETMNLVKKELDFWKNNPLPLMEDEELINVLLPDKSNSEFTVYEYDRVSTPNYHYKVKYFTNSDLITDRLDNEDHSLSELYKLHITIEKNNREISETFGYVHLGGIK